jgi:hypothetical protein
LTFLTQKTTIWHNNHLSRRFERYSFQKYVLVSRTFFSHSRSEQFWKKILLFFINFSFSPSFTTFLTKFILALPTQQKIGNGVQRTLLVLVLKNSWNRVCQTIAMTLIKYITYTGSFVMNRYPFLLCGIFLASNSSGGGCWVECPRLWRFTKISLHNEGTIYK